MDDPASFPRGPDHALGAAEGGIEAAMQHGPRSTRERHDLHDRASGRTPDVVGLGDLDARAVAKAAAVRLSVRAWETWIGPWGLVVDQDPGPGAHVRRGSRVVVVVSCRPQTPVPDVAGLPLEVALERLMWLGLVPLVFTRRPSANVPAGHVEDTRPGPGSLTPCGSVVALTVARSGAVSRTQLEGARGGIG